MSGSKKFRNWDDRYADSDYLFGTAPNDFLKSVADRMAPNSRVLCLADGEGRNGVYLATLGHKVTALKPGGILILESYTPEQLNHGTGGPPISDLMLTKDELAQYFSEMNLKHLQELEREVIEGTGHTGLASVVQLLALR